MLLKDCPRGIFKSIYDGNTAEDPDLLKTLKEKPPFPLALLRNIEFNGEIVEGHCWYPLWGTIEVSAVSPGDKIQFLASPRWYAANKDWWQTGLSQICWVQKESDLFERSPVFSPPETEEEAKYFLDRRLRVSEGKSRWDDNSEWGVKIWSWDEDFYNAILQLIDAGWASFAPWGNYPIGFESIFSNLEDRFKARKISQIADIAAWCNLGSTASEYRVGGLEYRICSALEFFYG